MPTEALELLATEWVVTVEELKLQMIVEHDDDDELLARLVRAAVAWAEGYTGRGLLLRRMRYHGRCWPSEVRLEPGPVREILSIGYTDGAASAQVLPIESWRLAPGADDRVQFTGQLPGLNRRFPEVFIEYIGGYGHHEAVGGEYGTEYPMPYGIDGSRGDVMPEDIRHAILMLAAHWYENREGVVIGTITSTVPFTIESLLYPHRRLGL